MSAPESVKDVEVVNDPEEKRRAERRRIFEQFDADKSGDIDINEFHNIMDALGMHKPCDELRAIVKVATEGSPTPKTMTFEQFDLLFSTSRLKDIFDELDTSKKGKITLSQLYLAMEKAGDKRSESECNKMMAKLDKDGDNEISFEEFRSFFEFVPLASLASIAKYWKDSGMLLTNMNHNLKELERKRKRREIFENFDADKSGDIDINEFHNIMDALGMHKPCDELRAIVKIATEGSATPKTMTFEQFDNLFSTSRLKDTFDEMDVDNAGTITSDKLRSALAKLGHNISQRQCDAMIKKIDLNGDNVIDFSEFISFFENVPLASMTTIANHWEQSALVTDGGTDMAPIVHYPGCGLYWWQTILAGGCAGIVSRTITAPLEKVKITAQTGMDGGRGVTASLRNVYMEQGVRGLFAGNFLNCVRVFPTAGITCTIYLNLLALTPADNEFDVMEPVYRVGCAGVAALVGNTLTYPIDLIRARVTVQSDSTSILSHVKHIYRDAGMKGFLQGLRPTLLAVVPFVAIQNATIDILRDEAAFYGMSPTPSVLLAVGACSGLLAQSVVYPLDVLRRRMQLHSNTSVQDANIRVVSDKTWLAMRKVVAMHGFKSLYAGIVPTFLKTIPAIGVVSLVTNSINAYYKKKNLETPAPEMSISP